MSDLKAQLQGTLGAAYSLERELGGGGMSRVFVAEETAFGRRVVVKLLSPELVAGVNVDRFKREIQLAAKLQHPHIVPVITAGESNGLPYYTMPFVDGESLRARLGRLGALPIGEAIGIMRDVAKALAYAHEQGVVHRDIKPDNVLLAGGSATVADFGIAKAIAAAQSRERGSTLTQVGSSIGTPMYMAPEQAAGEPGVDHRADIYSFACMAYEMFTGQPPFTGKTPQRLLAAHMAERPRSILELRGDVPAPLAELVMRCLEKEPQARPQSVTEMMPLLETTTSGDRVAAPGLILGAPGMLPRALLGYAMAVVVVAILARAAIIGIGLPDWVFPGAILVMALGLPAILFTGYAQGVARRTFTATPTYTPGGTPSMQQGTMATIALKASPHLSWKRTTLWGVYAIGVFVFIIAAFMTLRALGIGPAGSLLARGSLTRREPLLITDFAAHGADSSLGSVVAEAVRADLSQSSAITLVPPATIAAALARMRRPASTRLELAVAREMALREGIKAIVDGEITALGAGYVVAVRLVSADSARELTSFRTVVATPADLIDGINKLSRELRGKMGESLRSVHGSPALAEVTTSSLDALRKYTEGARANTEGDYPRAVALLRQAIAFDSTFGTAWAALAAAMANGRPFPQSQQDSALVMAYRYRDRMTAAARGNMEGRYFYSGPGRDIMRALSVYERLFQEDSSSVMANTMGIVLSGIGSFARAESAFAWSIQRNPDHTFPYGNIVSAQFNLGKAREAEASIALARRRHPEYQTGAIMAATMRYHKGDLVAYRQALDSLRSTSVSRFRITGTYLLSDLDLIVGRLRDSERRLAEGRSLDRVGGRTALPLVDSVSLATEDAWFRGQQDRAARRLDDALRRYPLKPIAFIDRPYFALATGYALAGRPGQAREIMRQFAADADTATLRAWHPNVQQAMAEIALAEGKPRDAIELFRGAQQATPGIRTSVARDPATSFAQLGRAYDLAHESDSAVVMFERYLNTPAWDRNVSARDPMYRAATYKRLGELYEAKGDRTKAAAFYTKFVDLWKGADPDLQPKVAEVRSRLGRLHTAEIR